MKRHADYRGIGKFNPAGEDFGKPRRKIEAMVKLERLDEPVDRKGIGPRGDGSVEVRRMREATAAGPGTAAGYGADGAGFFNQGKHAGARRAKRLHCSRATQQAIVFQHSPGQGGNPVPDDRPLAVWGYLPSNASSWISPTGLLPPNDFVRVRQP